MINDNNHHVKSSHIAKGLFLWWDDDVILKHMEKTFYTFLMTLGTS